jgi:hypothetical protein
LRSDIPEAAKLPTLQKYKAKIERLYATRLKKAMLDNDSKNRLEGEEPSLFHIIKMAERRETGEIRHVQDQHGNIVTRQQDILITWMELHIVPASKQPQNLYDIYLMLYVQS